MPVQGGGFGIAVANNKIYTFGVRGDNRTYEYDPLVDAWTERAQLPIPNTERTRATTVNDKIYVIDEHHFWEYDPLADYWTLKSPIPNPITYEAYSNMVTINNTIYVIGGDMDGHLNQVYDPSTNTWDLKTSMPTGRMVFGTAAAVGKIYVIGGESANAMDLSILNVNEVYDPATDTWSTATPMPTSRAGFGMVALGDKIYTIGGWQRQGSTDVFLTKNEEFTIPEFPSLILMLPFAVATLLAAAIYQRKSHIHYTDF